MDCWDDSERTNEEEKKEGREGHCLPLSLDPLRRECHLITVAKLLHRRRRRRTEETDAAAREPRRCTGRGRFVACVHAVRWERQSNSVGMEWTSGSRPAPPVTGPTACMARSFQLWTRVADRTNGKKH